MGVSKHNNRDFPARQVLLMPQVLIGSHNEFEASGFSRIEQRAVIKPLPSTVNRFDYNMRP